MRTTPEKGRPNLIALDDSRINSIKFGVQELIGAYKECDPEAVKVLTRLFKDLSGESIKRTCKKKDKAVTPIDATNELDYLEEVSRIKKSEPVQLMRKRVFKKK